MSKENRKTPQIRFPGFTDDWEQRKFGELYKRTNERNDGTFDKTKWISVAKMYYQEPDKVTSNNIDTRTYVMRIGDIAFEGHSNKEFAYGRFVENDIGDGVISELFPIYRPIVDYDLAYWKYAIQIEAIMRNIIAKCITSSGASSNKLVEEDLLKQTLLVPKLNEQRKIGQYFSNLDCLITLHQREYDVYIKLKKCMLQKMFPKNGKLVPEIRFPGFTDDWEQRKLGEVVEVCNGKDYKHLDEGNIPVYGTGGYMLSVSEALSYDLDAIGIGRKGTIDNPYLLKAPFWTVDTLFYCIPKDGYDLNFSYDIFQNINWKAKDESTGVPSLSKSVINSVTVLLPTLKEQEKIGHYFSCLDHLITLHQRECEKLKKLKKCMLQKMFV